MSIPVIIIVCFFSLIKTVFFLTGLIFCLHFHSMMKMWYGSTRPFWEKPELFKGICDGGFGNPSGHSMTSVYIYLTLFVFLRETKRMEKKYSSQIFLLLFLLAWTISIIFSRVILGVHAINQVIYGSTLGLIVFLIMFQVFKLHQMPVGFYRKLFKEKAYIFTIAFFLLVLTCLSIASKFIFNLNFNKSFYEKILNEHCSQLPIYRKFNEDALFGSLIVVGLAGIFVGQIVFWHLIDNRYKITKNILESNGGDVNKNNNREINSNMLSLNNNDEENEMGNEDSNEESNDNKIINELINRWNENRYLMFASLTNIFKILVVVMISIIPILLFLFLPKDANLLIIFLFKFGIPFFSVLFLIFGPGFYFIVKIACGPKDILLKHVKRNNNIGQEGIIE